MFVMLTVVAIVGYLLTVLITFVNRQGKIEEVRSNLRHVGLALLNYESTQGSFPPQVLLSPIAKPYQGWRGIILPCTESHPLPLDNHIAWNAPANVAISKLPCRVYCGLFNSTNQSRIIAVTGPGNLFDGMQKRKLKHLTRNPSKIIMLIDVENSGISWAEPKDWTEAEFIQRFNARTIGVTSDGFFAVMADESVQLIEYSRGLNEVLRMFRVSDN